MYGLSGIIVVLSFTIFIVRAARREMQLCARLIDQMEAAQEAENKSKSISFANASHDIRASLACISALIQMCHIEAEDALTPKLWKTLQQMDNCVKDLLGLLNSLLDASKIEAGKMLLEEEEFDLAQLLEDVVDMFHPVAMNKGIDMEPSSEDHTIHKANKKVHRKFSWLFFWKGERSKDIEEVSMLQRDPNSMEFVFEVNDTGKGTPKEKRKSAFKNYVQVKESAH
ncbi:hypothetical protein CRG98_035514 [Punica granatum]|uniref:histidine kinase n=1 Tax=Punica granatum TaxID=22663 RepID=A0A2I0IJF5_PUNGR|nr:hypothetical protein CRG98_035514 [Punica granatum]